MMSRGGTSNIIALDRDAIRLCHAVGEMLQNATGTPSHSAPRAAALLPSLFLLLLVRFNTLFFDSGLKALQVRFPPSRTGKEDYSQ